MKGEVFSPEIYSTLEIKRGMIISNINQKEMAMYLGVSEQFMSRVLKGRVAGKHLRLRATIFLQSLEE